MAKEKGKMGRGRSKGEESTPGRAFARVREPLDLPRHLPYQIVHASSLLSVGFARLLQRRFRLGIREWRILAVLGHGGPMAPSDLVGRAAYDKGTVSRALQRLERRGLVRREPAGAGRRRWIVGLTPEGAELHDRIAPLARMRARILQAALSPEEARILGEALAKLT
ncbi:MAG: MarR family transcriptional regulator, partial [Alphaproteobacteria bacterium]